MKVKSVDVGRVLVWKTKRKRVYYESIKREPKIRGKIQCLLRGRLPPVKKKKFFL
jgi:hypothetical protein